jgi:hypothetical protein
MHAAALAASFAPISPDFQLNIWNLLALLLAVLAVVGHFRRTPPLDSELVKLNGAISGLDRSVTALTKSHQDHVAHAGKIAHLEEQVRDLKGHRESDAQNQRSYIAKNTREIFEKIDLNYRDFGKKLDETNSVITDKIDALSRTFNQEVRDLARALGKTEGKLEAVDVGR